MTITANPSVRQVLSRVVQDPRYPAIARKPLLSAAHIGLTAICYATFAGATWAYLDGDIPFVVMLLLNQFAIFASFSPEHDAVHGAVSRNERVNNLIGTVSIQLLVPGLCTTVYRILHMEHHRWVGDPDRDPDDLFVKAPKPILPLVLIGPVEIWASVVHPGRCGTGGRCGSGRCSSPAWAPTSGCRRRCSFPRGAWTSCWSGSCRRNSAYWCWSTCSRTSSTRRARTGRRRRSSPRCGPCSSRIGKVYMLGQSDHCMHHALPHIPFHRYHKLWELSDSVLRTVGIPERGLFRGPGAIEVPRAAYDNRLPAEVLEALPVGGAGTVSFLLGPVDGELPDFTPGSHLDVHLPSGRIRQYSLCNAPGGGTYRIAVKPEPNGRGGSIEVHETLRPGTIVTISEPRNNFERWWAPTAVRARGRWHRHHPVAVDGPPVVGAAGPVRAARVRAGRRLAAVRRGVGAGPVRRRGARPPGRDPGPQFAGPREGLRRLDAGQRLVRLRAGRIHGLGDRAGPRPSLAVGRRAPGVVRRAGAGPHRHPSVRPGVGPSRPHVAGAANRQILDVLAANEILVPFSCSQARSAEPASRRCWTARSNIATRFCRQRPGPPTPAWRCACRGPRASGSSSISDDLLTTCLAWRRVWRTVSPAPLGRQGLPGPGRSGARPNRDPCGSRCDRSRTDRSRNTRAAHRRGPGRVRPCRTRPGCRTGRGPRSRPASGRPGLCSKASPSLIPRRSGQRDGLGPAGTGFRGAEPESDPVGALRSVTGTHRSRASVDLRAQLRRSFAGVPRHPEIRVRAGEADGAGAGRRHAACTVAVPRRAIALRRAGSLPRASRLERPWKIATGSVPPRPAPLRAAPSTGAGFTGTFATAGVSSLAGSRFATSVATAWAGSTTGSRVVLSRACDSPFGHHGRSRCQYHRSHAEHGSPGLSP